MADTTALMGQLLLLPDEISLPRAEKGLGLVSMPGQMKALEETGMAMRPSGKAAPLTGSDDRLNEDPERLAHWRGLTAVALLCDTWSDMPVMRVVPCTAGTSAFAKAALAAAHADILRLCVLGTGENARVLGILDDWQLLRLPASREDLGALLPDRVTWYDRETHAFRDPGLLLNDRDRATLMARLSLMTGCEQADAFRANLEKDADSLTYDCTEGEQAESWRTCVRLTAGLMPELEDDTLSVQEVPYHDRPLGNALLAALGLSEAAPAAFEPQLVWSWRGTAFAVSHHVTGLRPLPGFDFAPLEAECALMEQTSRRFAADLAQRLDDWTAQRIDVLPEKAKKNLMLWSGEARLISMTPAGPLMLRAPWDQRSPAIRLLLRELLGDTLAAAAVTPFSDKLCLIPGGVLGDLQLQQRCAMVFGSEIYTAVPPISPALARFMAAMGWTGRGVAAETMTLTADDEGIEASITLQGTGSVTLVRHYGEDEILMPEAAEVPRVSLFPSVPIADDRWKLFYLSVKGRVSVSFPDGDEWITMQEPAADDLPEQPEDGTEVSLAPAKPVNRVIRLHRLPQVVCLGMGGMSIGTLMYRAVPFTPPEAGAAVAALEVGTAGTAMSMVLGGQVIPVSLPCLWHVMLHGPKDDISDEALPVTALGPVIPSAVLLHGDQGDEPLLDGHVCLESQLDGLLASNANVMYDLLWRRDEDADRARRILWREAMLLTAFHAVMCGAGSIGWRVILPHGMAPEGRRRLLEEVRATAEWLAPESGLPQTVAAAMPVGLRETLCAGMELRDTGVMRGGFVMVNVGSSGAEVALWLRGLTRPAAELHADLGVSSMLMGALTADPTLLTRELSALGWTEERLVSRGMGSGAWSMNRLLLDRLTGAHLTQSMGLMNMLYSQGGMTRTQSLLLLGFAQLMTLTGITLQQVRENSLLNDYLPPELTVLLMGRGREVLVNMPPELRNGVASFIRVAMEPSHPVRRLRMSCLGDARLTGVNGLAHMKHIPEKQMAPDVFTTEPVPMLQLVARFLHQFSVTWPAAFAQLFPGLMNVPGIFTPEAQQMISSVVNSTRGGVHERFNSCIPWIMNNCHAAKEVVNDEPASR